MDQLINGMALDLHEKSEVFILSGTVNDKIVLQQEKLFPSARATFKYIYS